MINRDEIYRSNSNTRGADCGKLQPSFCLVTIGNFDAMRHSSEIASFTEMGNVGRVGKTVGMLRTISANKNTNRM